MCDKAAVFGDTIENLLCVCVAETGCSALCVCVLVCSYESKWKLGTINDSVRYAKSVLQCPVLPEHSKCNRQTAARFSACCVVMCCAVTFSVVMTQLCKL